MSQAEANSSAFSAGTSYEGGTQYSEDLIVSTKQSTSVERMWMYASQSRSSVSTCSADPGAKVRVGIRQSAPKWYFSTSLHAVTQAAATQMIDIVQRPFTTRRVLHDLPSVN